MATWIRRHLSFANVISLLALVLALGGAAYAVTKAPKNSVVSKSVKNKSLKGKDIKDQSLKGKDIKDNSLKGADIDESSLGKVPNADAVDGHSAECPPATVENAGWCFDSAASPPGPFPSAVADCNGKGGALPTLSQLAGIRNLDGINLSDPAAHWVDAPFQNPVGVNRAMTYDDGANVSSALFAAARAYRCAYPLVR